MATYNDSVENRLQGLLSTDSPYLRQARTGAMQQANQRGLLNSSMAVGAAEDARIKSALPIAQQDAEIAARKNLSDQEYQQQRGLAEQRYGFDTNLTNLQHSNTLARDAAQFGYQKQLAEQGHGFDTDILARQQTFQGEQSAQARALERERMAQDYGITQQELAMRADEIQQRERMQGRELDQQAALAAAQRELEQEMQQRQYAFQAEQAALDRAQGENALNTEYGWRMALSDADMNTKMLMEQYKQDNLAYAQYIKGVADINQQDLEQGAKDAAVSSLWDNYMAGRPIGSQLQNIRIENGQVVYI